MISSRISAGVIDFRSDEKRAGKADLIENGLDFEVAAGGFFRGRRYRTAIGSPYGASQAWGLDATNDYDRVDPEHAEGIVEDIVDFAAFLRLIQDEGPAIDSHRRVSSTLIVGCTTESRKEARLPANSSAPAAPIACPM